MDRYPTEISIQSPKIGGSGGVNLDLDTYRINRAVFLLTLILCACLFTVLFYNMSTATIVDDGSPYYSDFVFHIESAITAGSYSLIGLIIKYLFMLPYDTAALLLSVIIAALELLTVFAVYLLLLEMDRIAGKQTSERDRAVYMWLSLASIFIISIVIPGVLPSFQFLAFNMTCWQNDTYLAMRPFSILALVFFLRIYNTLEERFDWKDLVCFSVMLFLSTWMKPSFFMGFAILLLLLALWHLMKNKDKYEVFKRYLILLLCTVPSLVCILVQNTMLFGDEGNSIILAPFLLVSLRVTNWQLALAVFLLFPLLVLFLERRALGKKTIGFIIIWLLWVVQNFIAFFLAEGGSRTYDFNFGWGMVFSDGLLYVASYYMWYNRYTSDDRDMLPCYMDDPVKSKRVARNYYIFGGVLLAYLVFLGVFYFILLSQGYSFTKL